MQPAVSTNLNERIPEAQRATVLSLETGFFSLAMMVLYPLFGLGLAHLSYGAVYRWTLFGFIGAVSALVVLVRVLLRRRKATPGLR